MNRIGHCLPPKMGHTQVKTLLPSVKKGRWGQSCGGVSTSKCGRGTHGAFIQVPLGCSPARCAPTPGRRGKAGGSGLARVAEDVGGPAGELGMEPLTGMLRTGTTLPPPPRLLLLSGTDFLLRILSPSDEFLPQFSFFVWPPHGTWSSWARDQIQAADVTCAAAAATRDPLTHCAGLWMESASWSCRDSAHAVVPQRELQQTCLMDTLLVS